MELWGVWGGRHPGGWCYGMAFTRFSCSGTKEQAELVVKEFLKENNGCDYQAIPFDNTKDPIGTMGKPSPAQYKLLERISKTGQAYGFNVRNERRSCRVLFDRGWIIANFNDNGDDIRWRHRLTKMGQELLDKRIL